CLALSLLLKDKVSFPGSQVYRASLGSYFSLQQAQVNPLCIVAPQTTEDVSTAVRALTTPAPTCQFAVRSGGHSSFSGASNIQGGITIDLRALDRIELSQDRSIVSLGVGASWGSVYSYLDGLNLSVTGGRSFGVGVGGVSIGGGISYFAPRYGWACDMIINYVVVLADGSIVNANQDENPDLLWALRGGTNNFGIVTRVDMQAFEQGGIWGGVVYHPISTVDEEIAALSEFNTPDTYDDYSSLISSFAYSGANGISLIINSMENTKGVVKPPAFQPFANIHSLGSTMRMTNMTYLSMETEAMQVNGLRYASATLTIESTIEAINATVCAWNASVPFIQDIPGIVWTVVLEPLPPAIYARHAEGNALGLTGRQGKPLMVMMLSMTWSNAEDDDRIGTEAKTLMKEIEGEVSRLGKLDPFVYLNYAASWQKPITSYGEVNVDRLLRVRNEYDPRRVFTKYVPGGFKIQK
ncbi:FAD-binding domain-containing protein, partial [Mollisia scopiformis]